MNRYLRASLELEPFQFGTVRCQYHQMSISQCAAIRQDDLLQLGRILEPTLDAMLDNHPLQMIRFQIEHAPQ